MKKAVLLIISFLLVLSCISEKKDANEDNKKSTQNTYFEFQNKEDRFTGGIKMIPITTPKGDFKVWTKRVGNNPKIKVLLLHGGPGFTHEIYECFDGFFPKEGIEYIYYDQLGSYYSDQPEDQSLWTIERFVDEVEQVRIALGLHKDNFYLFGQSWGGILAMEYALKHQENLKGLIISNMVASAPEYNKFAQEVLGPQMDPKIFKEIQELEANKDFDNPRYAELLYNHHYTEHVLRMPINEWPDSVNRSFKHMNPNVYVYMQGYSEFGVTGDATLKNWDVKNKLSQISPPTLVIGSKYDTMDPQHMEWMSNEVQNGRFLYCPNGSHLSQYDDQEIYFNGLIRFLKDVDTGLF